MIRTVAGVKLPPKAAPTTEATPRSSAQALRAAGLIAICTSATGATGITLTHHSAEVDDAVEELLHTLDSYGVLHHGDGFSGGEGI